METCDNANSNGDIINWVLYPVVTATAMTLKINVVAVIV